MDLIIGPYRVTGRLGQDAAGEVLLAHDPGGRQVAVKVLDPALTADPGVRWRFQQETGAASRVAPRCVVPVLSAGFDGDRAYVVTEHVEGPSLRERVGDQGPLAGPGLGSLAVSVAVALQAIHAAGIAHGRLTPSGILLSPLGPRVGGFGLAGLPLRDVPGEVAPPERARGEAATAASDVFSWGAAVLYAATGRDPYGRAGHEPYGDADAGDPEETARAVRLRPDLTGLHGPLRDLVASALAEDPARRPDVRDIVRALTGVSDPAAAPVPPRPPAAGGAPAGPPAAGPAPIPPAGGQTPAPIPPVGGPMPAPAVIGQGPAVQPSAGTPADPPAAGPAPVRSPVVPEPVPPPAPRPGAALPPVPRPGTAPSPVAAVPGQAPPPAVPAVPGYAGATPAVVGTARRTDAARRADEAVPDTARQVRRHLIPAVAGLVLAGVIAGVAWLLPRDPATGDVASQARPSAPESAGPAPTGSPAPVTASPSPSPSPVKRTARPSTARTLPFQDDFGAAGGWSSTAAGNAGKHRPDHGAYRLTVRAGADLPVTAPVTASLRNTVITVKVRLISGKGDFGVFCRGRKGTAERYEFALTGDGAASITRSGKAPSAVRRVPGLRPGRLTVLQAVCRGGATGTTLSLRVNGKEVVSQVDRARPPTAGSIGVFARGRRGGPGLDVAFNSFEARP
ncbi:serine/threonine-protein kinase [Streptosporangium sp. NPDC048047]|uniref:serine/threonine-protein kinase n=1 Tax=Streptosporangium sp. NPDC048047 TaxID=3155748 RepID=UPI0034396118